MQEKLENEVSTLQVRQINTLQNIFLCKVDFFGPCSDEWLPTLFFRQFFSFM